MKNMRLFSTAKIQSYFTIIATVLALHEGETTVFYLLYLFWFIEFLRTIINIIYRKWKVSQTVKKYPVPQVFQNFTPIFIYFIFIIIIFGLYISHDNWKIIQINLQVLAFQNWYFNANLIFFVCTYIFELFKNEVSVPEINSEFGILSINLMILHASLILGILIWAFLIRPYPEYFTPENTLGSIFISIPFLILQLFLNLAKEKTVGN